MTWKFDTTILKIFNRNSLPKWQWFFVMTAHVAFLFISLYLLPILYFLLNNTFLPIIQLSTFAVASIAVGFLMKAIILRPRPHNLVTYLGKADSSFPSSHTSVAIGLAVILSMYVPMLTVLWFLLAFLVALGRIYIQMHYPTDVVGGIIIGLILSYITLHFVSPSFLAYPYSLLPTL